MSVGLHILSDEYDTNNPSAILLAIVVSRRYPISSPSDGNATVDLNLPLYRYDLAPYEFHNVWILWRGLSDPLNDVGTPNPAL